MNIELPFPGLCKTRNIPGSQLYYCRVCGELPRICHYSITFGDDYLCLYTCNNLYVDNHVGG